MKRISHVSASKWKRRTPEVPSTLTGTSEQVPGAYEATFVFAEKGLTAHVDDPATLQSLGFDGCGLTPGEEKDISDTGCSFLTSIEACGQEYDLVQRDGERLYLGARPADGNLCTQDWRPTALGEPLVPADASP